MGALIEYVAPEFSARLTEQQKNLVIECLYSGMTLLSICEAHKIKRYEVDLEARSDSAFGDAIKNAKRALGDIQAERVETMLLGLMKDALKDDTDQRLKLSIAKELSSHYRWCADRTSEDHKRKQAEKPNQRTAKRLQTNVPRAEGA